MTMTSTTMQTARSKWATYKPQAIALAVGLAVGPFVSNYMGWQVTSGKAQAMAHAGIVEMQAAWCDVRARAAVAEPGKLDWSARVELAKKWAVMPGLEAAAADGDVASACERKLQS